MIWTLILVILLLWVLGYGFAVGNLIHLLLLVVLVLLFVQLAQSIRGGPPPGGDL